MAGAGTIHSFKEEVLGGACMDSTIGLGAKGSTRTVLVWTMKESGGMERPGRWAEPTAREVSEV